MSETFDRVRIEAILPHREPFLFVDEVVAIEPERRIVGRWHVGESIGFLSAPDAEGRRHLPSTILAESMAQVGAILVLYSEKSREKTIYFRSIENARFERRIASGQTVCIEATIRRMRARFGSLDVGARLEDAAGESDVIATGVMSFALG